MRFSDSFTIVQGPLEGRVTSAQTTASATYGPLSGPSVTFTKRLPNSALDIDLKFSGSNSSALGSTAFLRLKNGAGVIAGGSFASTSPALSSNTQSGTGGRLLTGVAAGSVTISVDWRRTGGTLSCDPTTDGESCTLKVTEIIVT